MFRKLSNKRLNDIKNDFGENDLIKVSRNANFYGQESQGLKQIRGNGVLTVTPSDVIFYMWLPKRKIIISRREITSLEIVTKFLRKIRLGRKLLKINFINNQGRPDAVAWDINDMDQWFQLLKP